MLSNQGVEFTREYIHVKIIYKFYYIRQCFSSSKWKSEKCNIYNRKSFDYLYHLYLKQK